MSKNGFMHEIEPINQEVGKKAFLLKRESPFCILFLDGQKCRKDVGAEGGLRRMKEMAVLANRRKK